MKGMPVGVENFKSLIDGNYYLIDKTKLILEVNRDLVAFYTRPRRFGKTLNMSMLRYFYDLKEKENAYLFDGLDIQNYPDALKHQNQYPVISISLKDMKYFSFDEQVNKYRSLLAEWIILYYNDLINSTLLTDKEINIISNIYHETQGSRTSYSLREISQILYRHYGKKVIILIDEYDVPLQAAYQYGYYDQMVSFLRNVFSSALKTNDALEKGIMTGCLRIAKESIFTGMNNFRVHSIFDEAGSDCFGFTVEETKQLLVDYNLQDSYESIKQWYDGYLFGNTEIYNPWSLIQSVDDRMNDQPRLKAYWANTSGNDLVYNYIKQGNRLMKSEFQILVLGKSITKTVLPELTYRDMDEINNVYSFMLFAGYLKVKSVVDQENDVYELVIPNKEVMKIFMNQYNQYFGEIKKNKVDRLYNCLVEEKTEEANKLLNELLLSSISFYDNYESFYHGFMIGLFSDYSIQSNREEGLGRYDLFIREDMYSRDGIILELKYSKRLNELERDSEFAVRQIVSQKYIEGLEAAGYKDIKGYGVSFYSKNCVISLVKQ